MAVPIDGTIKTKPTKFSSFCIYSLRHTISSSTITYHTTICILFLFLVFKGITAETQRDVQVLKLSIKALSVMNRNKVDRDCLVCE